LETVLADLSVAGFDAEWGLLSAFAVGARHKRERLWILGKKNDNSDTIDLWSQRFLGQAEIQRDFWIRQQKDEPDVACQYHGIPNRLDALRGFGNAQVPLCAAMAFSILYQKLNL
jgi:site-specific DNA-cytosine methylase